jgi:predicted transposase YbfD/YdcC
MTEPSIVAIPALLEMLAIEGANVTIDTMGCQRNIAAIMLGRANRRRFYGRCSRRTCRPRT